MLLARYSDDDVRTRLAEAPLEARTAKTIVDIDALVPIAARARDDGYALSDQKVELGMRAMAVAVRDRDGGIAAAMSVSVSSACTSAAELTETMLPILRRHAVMLDMTLDSYSA